MNREEFLRQLERLLYDIPESERREAMEYYQNYFEDAGPENEAQIIEELGSPQEVAASIKKNLFGENYEEYDYETQTKQKQPYVPPEKPSRNILIGIIVVLTFPLWIGLIGGAFGLIVGGVACVFAFAVAVFALVGSLLLVGFILAGIGFANIFAGLPAVGMILISVGMFILAFAILGVIVIGWAFGRILPRTLRAIVRLCKRPFQKRGVMI